MKFFKRAIISLMRQPGKTIILLLVVFILGTVLSGAIAVRNAIIITEERLMMEMPALSTMVFNVQSAADATGSSVWELGRAHQIANQPTQDQISAIGNLAYVATYDVIMFPAFFSRDLLWSDLELDESRLPDNVNLNSILPVIQGARAMGGQIELFNGQGISNPNITDIDAGLITLIDGRTFTSAEIENDMMVVVISQDFATTNNLTVGSIIELENLAHDFRIMGTEGSGNFALDWHDERFILAQQFLEVEVIGIFDVYQEFAYEAYEGFMLQSALSERANLNNRIYMPIGVAERMLTFVNDAMLEIADELRAMFGGGDAQGLIEESPWIDSIFILNDPRDLDTFSVAATAILPEFWEMQDLRGVFAPITSSMDTVLGIAEFIQLITIGASAVVLTLVILLFLRDRRHEIGVYMALGEKKHRVLAQILSEISLIAILGITLALLAGNVMANVISRQMLEQHLLQQAEQGEVTSNEFPWALALFNPGALTIEETMQLYDVSPSAETLIIFVLTSGSIILLSVVVPIVYVLRLEPKKILL